MKGSLLFLACIIATICNGQSPKTNYKLGAEYKLPRKNSDMFFLGNEKTGLVNLSRRDEELNAQLFNAKSLALTSEKVIELPNSTKTDIIENALQFGNNIFWLHTHVDKETKKEVLYYDKINMATGKVETANVEMFVASKVTTNTYTAGIYQFRSGERYKFKYDSEHKKVLLVYKVRVDKYGLYVFDENMNQLWGREVSMPYEIELLKNPEFCVDGLGNAYSVANVQEEDSIKLKADYEGRGFQYQLLKFSASEEITKTPILFEENYLGDFRLSENSQHEIMVACTYSRRNKQATTIDGVYISYMDKSGNFVNDRSKFYRFPIDEITKFENSKLKDKMEDWGDMEMRSLSLRDVVTEPDGSVLVTCEQYVRSVSRTSTGVAGGSSITNVGENFMYGYILATKIKASGELDWVRKIPKMQKGHYGSGSMGFQVLNTPVGYYFIYNDNTRNLDMKEDESPKLYGDSDGGQLVVAQIDQKGIMTKQLLQDNDKENTTVVPLDLIKINNKQFAGKAVGKRDAFFPLLITVN